MNKLVYLSKSDYILSLDCRTKLFYKKMKYPQKTTEYLELLKAGGFMVGKLAQLLYDGVEILFDVDIEQSKNITLEHLQKNDNIVLFEATILIDNLLARVDILEKKDNTLRLIEVKSSLFDLEKFVPGTPQFKKRYQEKLHDIAFQYYVLKRMFPEKIIKGFLMMPDKNKILTIDNLASYFAIQNGSNNKSYEVIFTGDKNDIRKSNFLTEVDVTEVLEQMQEEVGENVSNYLEYLCADSGIKKFNTPLNKSCRDCEFRSNSDDNRDGYMDCWGGLANVSPHVFELYSMGKIGGIKEPLVNKLILDKKVSMYDIPMDKLTKELGKRQTIQINYTKSNIEWFSDDLSKIMEVAKYPLHFIDFEASVLAIPYHAGMRSYEKVAFQWSCHTIEKKGDEPKHYEWINVVNLFPNFEFAKTLKDCIKDGGTVLTWASYENTTLKEIKEQIKKYNFNDYELEQWLAKLIKSDENVDSRILDMNSLTLKHYFHPLMKGKTSLKYVLPAVWSSDEVLHNYEFSKKYFKQENGSIIDPYETLPKIQIAEQAEVVKEGTGAMMAYQEMLYGMSKNDSVIRENWKALLLRYCELDTAAMVLVWKHWENLLSQ